MKNWFLGVFLILIGTLIIGGSLFYWYEYRPSNIRKNCYSKVMDIIREKTNNSTTNEEANNLFRRCLVKEGLNAEDLVK